MYEPILANMSQDRFNVYLRSQAIPPDTGDYNHYERAKLVLFGNNHTVTPALYEKICGWIAAYVGV